MRPVPLMIDGGRKRRLSIAKSDRDQQKHLERPVPRDRRWSSGKIPPVISFRGVHIMSFLSLCAFTRSLLGLTLAAPLAAA